jgi:hypothetical protein
MYLIWFDDNAKRDTADKVRAAIDAYRTRNGVAPRVVLVNSADVCQVDGVVIHVTSYVQRTNFWAGMEVPQ